MKRLAFLTVVTLLTVHCAGETRVDSVKSPITVAEIQSPVTIASAPVTVSSVDAPVRVASVDAPVKVDGAVAVSAIQSPITTVRPENDPDRIETFGTAVSRPFEVHECDYRPTWILTTGPFIVTDIVAQSFGGSLSQDGSLKLFVRGPPPECNLRWSFEPMLEWDTYTPTESRQRATVTLSGARFGVRTGETLYLINEFARVTVSGFRP